MKIELETKLENLAIPYLELVLNELFHIPLPGYFVEEEARLVTVEDVIKQSNIKPDEVLRLFREVLPLFPGAEISAETFRAWQQNPSELILVDVRQTWEWNIFHLDHSSLLTELDLAKEIETWKVSPEKNIVVLCAHGIRSFSFTMFLRRRGILNAFSLKDGLEPLKKNS